MISLVTAFRKFKGSFDGIQRSAIYSWRDLPIVVPANEIDTINVCSTYKNIKILKDVSRGTDKGFPTQVPFFKDLMQKALPAINTVMVGFINSDIVLLDNFKEICDQSFEKYGFDIVITGSRYDVRLDKPLVDEASYKNFLDNKRTANDPNTSDIFITSKFNWRKILSEIPDFLMGRPNLNTWLHHYTEQYNAKRYNCTKSLVTLHCVHGPNLFKSPDGLDPTVQYNLNLWVPEKKPQIALWPEL